MHRTKEDLLKHYSEREPKRFIQYDFMTGWEEDDFIRLDCDGDYLSRGETFELMQCADVRVLISDNVRIEDVLRGIKKLHEWITEEAKRSSESTIGAQIDRNNEDLFKMLNRLAETTRRGHENTVQGQPQTQG